MLLVRIQIYVRCKSIIFEIVVIVIPEFVIDSINNRTDTCCIAIDIQSLLKFICIIDNTYVVIYGRRIVILGCELSWKFE